MTKRAIFLDRDGTLNEEVGYIISPAQFSLFDFTAEAIRLINENNWRAIVVTNQSGVARGHFDESFLDRIHQSMIDSLRSSGAVLDAVYYCPHHPEIGDSRYRIECDCRKPKPGMLLRAAKDFDLDLAECVVIGDRYGDIAMAHAAGAKGVLLKSGHGQLELQNERGLWPREPDHIAENLIDAVRWICSDRIAAGTI
jgi:D-glycero-D-manno-heptose 1,7-bisphosphate phosphatase